MSLLLHVFDTASNQWIPATPQLLGRGYDAADDSLKVKTQRKSFRDAFAGASLDSTIWDSSVGAGGAITTGSGILSIASGTTANAVVSATSKQTFQFPFRLVVGLSLSQRITNQTFFIELISVDATTGEPNGLNSSGWLFDGTIAAQAKYAVQADGLAPLVSASSLAFTTANGGFYEVEAFSDDNWFHSGVLDATSMRTNSYRRHQQTPDPSSTYKVRLRWLNGSTAPASSTTATVNFIAGQETARISAEIINGRSSAAAGASVPVAVMNSPGISGQTAHDTAITGSPIRIGARAISAPYSTVASGDAADLVATLQGVIVTRPWQIPEQEWSYSVFTGGIVNTTDVVLAAAAGAGLRRYIVSMQLKNANAVVTEVVLKDGATAIWRGHLSANMSTSEEVVFENPLRTTANTALNFACITTGAQVYVNAQGFIAA